MQISTSIDINSSLEKVFKVFSNLEDIEKRVSAILSIEVLEGPAQMAVGTKWKETRKMFGKEATETMWVTELVENSKYVVRADSHGTKYRTEYVFSKNENSSIKVKMTFGGQPYRIAARLMSVLGFLFAGSLKKMLEADMNELKIYCEKG